MEFNYILLLNACLLGIICGMAGYIWIEILVNENENGIFDFLPKLFSKYLLKGKITPIQHWKIKTIHVLFNCHKCFSGQLGLWVYFIFSTHRDIISLITCICISILTSKTIIKFYNQ